MANFGIKLDLLKLRGAFMRNLKGQTATMTPEEQKAIPILGGLHAIAVQQPQMNVGGTLGQDAFDGDGCPF